MAGLSSWPKLLLGLALLLGGTQPGWTQPSLNCQKEIPLTPLGSAPPSDVTVDGSGRIYVLHQGDGYLDVYNRQGQLLQHRGGQAEIRGQVAAVTVVSQWVGRLSQSALLASESGQQIIRGILLPSEAGLEWLSLRGQAEPILGPAALARDLQGNFWIWSEPAQSCLGFDANGQFIKSCPLPRLRRPLQLAVDSEGNFYCLDTRGLQVISAHGKPLYEVAQAQAMYLTGSDVLALAGSDWLRRYSPGGQLEAEVREVEAFRELEPIALSLDEEGRFQVYLCHPENKSGRVLKFSTQGKILQDFPQPPRRSSHPDPGIRLDYQSRIHCWSGSWLQKWHPGGKLERKLPYLPQAEPVGQLLEPSELTCGPQETIWLADSGNCRLQRFRYDQGWLAPITVGIQDGDPRGLPGSLAFNSQGLLHLVVYPRDKRGQVVLQTRNPQGQLLAQKPVCPAWGDPVVKIACSSQGDLYLYQSRVKTVRGWEEAPAISRYLARGQRAALAGGEGPGLCAPGDPTRRIVLKPQEDLVCWGQSLLLPSSGSIFVFNPRLEIQQEYHLRYKDGTNPILGNFAGAWAQAGILFLADIGGNCLQRVRLP